MGILTTGPMVLVPLLPTTPCPAHGRILYLFIIKLSSHCLSLYTKADDNLKFAEETSFSWVRDS